MSMRQRVRPEFRKRIDEAFEEASEAFWKKVAQAFPEADSGDFPPDAHMAWDRDARDAIATWVIFNVPRSEL